MWRTDFTHIKAGSLLKADGGFLVIDLTFLSANLLKIVEGGWMPLALGALVRGGLSMVTIGASMFFAEISGSAVAGVAALGTILIPAMRSRGYPVYAPRLPEATRHGHFVAPTLVEIPSVDVLGREVYHIYMSTPIVTCCALIELVL